MSEVVKEPISKRIVFIGDDTTGKSTIISAFVESHPGKKPTVGDVLVAVQAPKETPAPEEPKPEEPKAEEPKAEEPKAEEPKAEEPKAEEPKAEEPKAEEPKAEEPKAEEPKPEEPKPEEPKPEEPKAEEPVPETPKPEEPVAETNGTAKPVKAKEDNKTTEKAQSGKTDSEADSEGLDKEDPKLAAEIDELLVYATLKHEDQTYELAIWDAASENDFKENRAAVYKKADVIVLLYSIDSPASFKNINKKWKAHLKKNVKTKCPVILVGNKQDLRIKTPDDEESDEDEEKQWMTTNEGKKLSKKLGAVDFLECSAINKEGISEIFTKAAQYSVNTEAKSTGKCTIS